MSRNRKVSNFEEIILDLLKSNPEARLPFSVLQNALQVQSKNENKRLKKAINRLSDKNKIQKLKGGSIQLAEDSSGNGNGKDIVEGRLDVNRYGTGFVNVDDFDEDVRISSRHMNVALPNDWVKVQVFPNRSKDNRIEGKILEVLDRGKSIFVGTLSRESDNTYIIEPDEKSAPIDFFVLEENINGAKPNDKVVFELVDWAHPRSLPEARVLESIGKRGTHDAYMLSILAENQLQAEFPDEVTDYADRIATEIPEGEYERRRDIRDDIVFTIDPEDAKDFDDALSIRILDNGNYYLGVHIADVTYYMRRNSVLDEEAYERGTSVYLVDRVIPMLPEALSNGVCSLRPNEDKLTYSCFMEIAPNGKLVDYSIEETVIHSDKRFTYEEAQAVLDRDKGSRFKYQLGLLEKLAHTLLDKRFKEGSINFDTKEPKFVLDEEGKPIEIYLKERLFTHRLIEECMLMANKAVALHVKSLRDKSSKKNSKDLYPFLYRVHDQPDLEKLNNIRENVKPIGIDFQIDRKKVTSKTINHLLEQVKDTPLELSINDLMLRAMSKAEYSPKNIGHFGLGFDHYAHFTSPIRRYPDVIVHRLLKSYADDIPSYRYKELHKMGEHLSEREQAAVQAERDTIKLKQVEYLSKHVGDQFDGVVSGVIDKGIFVDLKGIHCEGMVHVSNLNDDYYEYDERNHWLIGRSKGKKFQIGTELKVRVAKTDMEQRTIDLQLVR